RAHNKGYNAGLQAERHNAHRALLAYAAPPVPPAVDRERNEEDLQQRIEEEPRPVENHEVQKVGEQDDRPADEQPLGSEPDAKRGDSEGGKFNEVRRNVVGDDRPDHWVATPRGLRALARRRRASRSSRPASL